MTPLDATPRRRLLALAALILALAAMAQFVALAIVAFPHAAIAIALVALGLASAWYGVARRGAIRTLTQIALKRAPRQAAQDGIAPSAARG